MRAQILVLLRSGMSLMDTLRLLGVGHLEGSLRREWEIDPDFHAECVEAMEDPFEPVLRHSLKLAMEADREGLNEGAHKALALVHRTYDKVLDRKTKVALGLRALDAAEKGRGQGPGSAHFVLGPGGVRELVESVADLRERGPGVIETTTIDEKEEDDG